MCVFGCHNINDTNTGVLIFLFSYFVVSLFIGSASKINLKEQCRVKKNGIPT